MPKVKFIEYVRPNGEPREIWIDMDQEVYDKAQKIREKGLTFTCEVLMNGQVAFYVTDDKNEEDVAIKIVNNGPKVPDTVKALIMDYKL